MTSRLVTAGATTAALAACAILGFVYPHELVGTAAWSVAVAGVLWGLGAIVGRVLAIDMRAGEQMIAGTALWITGGGLLLAIGQASRGPLVVLAAIGLLAACTDLFVRPSRAAAASDRGVWIVFWTLLSMVLALNLLSAIGSHGNPADDEASYTALAKRLLDCGDLIEPFSFRRLSAYGGQTVLQALVGLRGDVAATDLLDLGIFQWITVLGVVDIAVRRKLHVALVIPIVLFVLSLWELELNSGAMWTGVACFVGAYAFASREDLELRPKLILALALLGVACTLRQNYLAPAGLFGLLLVIPARAERRAILAALGAVAVVVVPYMVATFESSGTALYPILRGTGSATLPLAPSGGTWLDELGQFVSVAFSPKPIHVWWLLLPAIAVARDRRVLRPWRAFAIASGVGFAVLIHGFQLTDMFNVWRYGFAYLSALAIVFLVEASASLPFVERERPPLAIPLAATFMVWLALVVHLVENRPGTVARVQMWLQNIHATESFGSRKVAPGPYHRMQQAIPEGARVAALVDDPWLLDFARNRIVLLDFPGAAAPAPGLPSFTDAEHWRSYFVAQGIRYLAFAESDLSTYMYRRINWVWRMYEDDELYQFLSARLVDAIDTLAQLATSSRVLFHGGGLYAIDLGDAPSETDRGAGERDRMDAFTRRISEHELGSNAWQLASRSDVVFEADGTAPSVVMPPPTEQRGWGIFARLEAQPHRWLMERTHLRVRADGRRRVHVKLWVKPSRATTSPTATVYLDGEPLASGVPDSDGYLTLDGAAWCDGWCDLYIAFSSTFDWWAGPEDNGLAQLLELTWSR